MSVDRTSDRLQGRVKWFNSEKGFGFVLLSDGRDAYLPYTSLPSDLQKLIEDDLGEGLSVECEVQETEQGLRACHIELVGPVPGQTVDHPMTNSSAAEDSEPHVSKI